MAKLLKETYKTYEGARKRAAFENGIALGEYKRGDKARLYHYRVCSLGENTFRVEQSLDEREAPSGGLSRQSGGIR